jgi:hypothetical protein
MRRFAKVLRRASDELDLPRATKSRILLEMAGDLEDLYQHHLARGLDSAEAEQRATDAFAASDEALKHLASIHESSGPWTDRVARQAGTAWGKALLVVWVVVVLLIAGRMATEPNFFLVVSPFVWPLAGLAIAGLAFTLWKLHQLFVRKPLDARGLRSGLGVPLFLAAASLALSVCGFFFHLRWYAFQTYEVAPDAPFLMFSTWTLAISSMMVLGLLTSVLTALLWFVLASMVARIENREAEALLAT